MKIRKQNDYSKEAEEKWGRTDAYLEYAERSADRNDKQNNAAGEGLMQIIAEFSDCRKEGKTPDSEPAQALAAKLQKYITDNYYTCTKEILNGLGQMYVCDARFRENMDRYGKGTARFVSDTISVYCGKENE